MNNNNCPLVLVLDHLLPLAGSQQNPAAKLIVVRKKKNPKHLTLDNPCGFDYVKILTTTNLHLLLLFPRYNDYLSIQVKWHA